MCAKLRSTQRYQQRPAKDSVFHGDEKRNSEITVGPLRRRQIPCRHDVPVQEERVVFNQHLAKRKELQEASSGASPVLPTLMRTLSSQRRVEVCEQKGLPNSLVHGKETKALQHMLKHAIWRQ